MDALADKEIDYCILSTASLLKLRPDIMLAEFMTRPLTILGEFALATDLCLCALPGTTMHECDCVMSDSTLLKMSEALILKLENGRGSPIVRQAAWDSAGACFIVRNQATHGIAVLASKDAAHDAGLDVLADHLAGAPPPCLPAVLRALADTYAHIVDIQTCSSIVPELQVLITFMPSVPSPFAKIPQQLLQCLDHLSNSMHVFDAYFSLATVP
ncbi:hypothetical protein KRP22_008372 [Phytophthora ramorum]|nr:hypothetical protein KRP22_3615 [Phytophthora ramorum]